MGMRKTYHLLLSCILLVAPATAPAGVEFIIDVRDDDGVGFNDPTPFNGTTLGEARLSALHHAANIWESLLINSYENESIIIAATMPSLSGPLASAGPSTSVTRPGDSRFEENTRYALSLANHIAQQELMPPPFIFPQQSHIGLGMNRDVNWYVGTDASPAFGEFDFVTVALHEIGHGLGFIENVRPDGSYGPNDQPNIYDHFLTLGETGGTKLMDMASDSERAAAILSDNLYWDGAQGIAGNGGARPKIYAPTEFDTGSSLAHLDQATYPWLVLSPVYSGPNHSISAMELGILADMGWTVIVEPAWDVDDDGVWAVAENWTGLTPDGLGTAARFGSIIQADRTVTVDTPVTVGSIRFDNADHRFTLAGSGGITIGGTPGQINVDSGSHTISTSVTLDVDTAVNVAQANDTLTVSNLTAAGFNLTKDGAGTLEVNTVSAAGLAVNDGTVQVLPGSGASVIGSISVSAGAVVDLTDNSLTVENGDLDAINALISSGYAGGSWTGNGITSSSAAAEGGRAIGIGVDGDDVVAQFTWAGDATLDGAVTIADLGVLAANWQGSDKRWFEGDFNYDSGVTIADLGILAANWQAGTSGGMSFDEALAMFDVFDGVVIPEPAGLCLLGIAAMFAGRHRTRLPLSTSPAYS